MSRAEKQGPTIHRVKVGETISSLAYDSGLLIETIWHDPNNANLRKLRSTWDHISPGDDVYIREIQARTEDGATEQRHRFRKNVQVGVIIRIDLDPDDASICDDRFVLKCDDGSYNVEKTVQDDIIPGDRYIDLHYTGLKPKKRYTLEVNPGEDGEFYTIFENIPYEELTNLYATEESTDFEPGDVVLEDGGVDDDDLEDNKPYPNEPDDE